MEPFLSLSDSGSMLPRSFSLGRDPDFDASTLVDKGVADLVVPERGFGMGLPVVLGAETEELLDFESMSSLLNLVLFLDVPTDDEVGTEEGGEYGEDGVWRTGTIFLLLPPSLTVCALVRGCGIGFTGCATPDRSRSNSCSPSHGDMLLLRGRFHLVLFSYSVVNGSSISRTESSAPSWGCWNRIELIPAADAAFSDWGCVLSLLCSIMICCLNSSFSRFRWSWGSGSGCCFEDSEPVSELLELE